MPYKTIDELPERVRHVLPKHAQEIFKEAFNHAEKEYKDPAKRRGDASLEQTAFKVAWSAVEKQYHKNAEGKWVANK